MSGTTWRTYEEVATHLLRTMAKEFGLEDVEGKQTLPGQSGTVWEIDAKGIREGSDGVVVIECRRYTKSRIKQEDVAGLAYRIQDMGAEAGIIVSPLGLQEGATKVAASSGVQSVLLSPGSTTSDYLMRFLNRLFIGVSEQLEVSDSVEVIRITRADGAEA